ncbi:MAG: hypothetical protein CO143_01790 [Candidatus Moranbacteria bacterium CG_4_9_14_3_um_filter_45_14]|nr:MAG: hypothetical protein CO143_01790 [Candidatus Moranbacteria bacterium CG_4_9_14_3_um_filter_45_14]
MNMKILFLGMDSITVAIFLLILVFSVGIVWRVEKELDLSYKFFVVSALFLTVAEILSFYANQTLNVVLWDKGLRVSGAIFLLVSVMLMRDLVRKLDGEKGFTKK